MHPSKMGTISVIDICNYYNSKYKHLVKLIITQVNCNVLGELIKLPYNFESIKEMTWMNL